MKLYPSLNVELTYQNSGTSWRGILRGSTNEIELAFNGLYNFCATNGSLIWADHLKTCACIWTDRKALRRFFFNQYLFPRLPDYGEPSYSLFRQSVRFARNRLKELSATSHENFVDWDNYFDPPTYGNGTIVAERPDSDFKSAVLSHAFRDKSDEKK